jgi:single stranded DNA-binding protein
MTYQRIILVGNATRAAKVEQSEGKMAYSDFTLAVDRNREQADFFPVRVFRDLVEPAARIEKGSLVLVEGRVEIDRFVPKQGEPRTTVRVLGETIRLLQQPDQTETRISEGEGQS